MNVIVFSAFQIVCMILVLQSVVTLLVRNKYLSTQSSRSQMYLVLSIGCALAALDDQSIIFFGLSVACYTAYVQRLLTYLSEKRQYEKCGLQCPQEKRA